MVGFVPIAIVRFDDTPAIGGVEAKALFANPFPPGRFTMAMKCPRSGRISSRNA